MNEDTIVALAAYHDAPGCLMFRAAAVHVYLKVGDGLISQATSMLDGALRGWVELVHWWVSQSEMEKAAFLQHGVAPLQLQTVGHISSLRKCCPQYSCGATRDKLYCFLMELKDLSCLLDCLNCLAASAKLPHLPKPS